MKKLNSLLTVAIVAIAMPLAALAGEGKNVNVDVKGMTCSACEDKITTALNSVDGVEIKKVDAKSGKVLAKIDTEKTNAGAVVDAINKAGFEAKEKSEAKGEQKG